MFAVLFQAAGDIEALRSEVLMDHACRRFMYLSVVPGLKEALDNTGDTNVSIRRPNLFGETWVILLVLSTNCNRIGEHTVSQREA